jgi:methionine biosynthesis protein MetW
VVTNKLDNRFIIKLKKVFAYLLSEYAFKDASFDYEGYWEQLSASTEHPASIFKLRLIESLIDKGSSVLDMGCGDGILLQHLIKTRSIRGKGMDISEKGIELTRGKGIEAERADLAREDFRITGTYDYIILSEVIEHLPKPEELLKMLKGKFNKNLIITIPNTGFLGERLRLLLGRSPKQWVYHPSEHLRFWTVDDFLFWAEQLGLKVERYHGLLDEYYDIKIPLWKWFPRLFSRYILYYIEDVNNDLT